MARRPYLGLAVLLAIALAGTSACGRAPDGSPDAAPTATAAGPSMVPGPSVAPDATSVPAPGHEVYGFVPYWEMDAGIAAHLRATDLTTIGLFSVTTTASGSIDASQNGYRRITGAVGRGVIRDAHARGVRVEIVFTSFGLARNQRFFGSAVAQAATITSLVSLVGTLGADGIDVDVESLDPLQVPAYGSFVGSLRAALVAAVPAGRLSVATGTALLGAAMAAAAAGAGADRIFLMGYDYRVAGSEPGATAPLDRRDGDEKDLAWSLDLYQSLGVPVERTLLGLPLYGIVWPVTDPGLGSPATGPGQAWILRNHVDLLRDPSIVPVRDTIEVVEMYAIPADGSKPVASQPGSSGASAQPQGVAPSPGTHGLRAIYVDSPATLEPKLALANARGLAGAGFWAIGYERGLPAYTELIGRFAAGQPMQPAPEAMPSP